MKKLVALLLSMSFVLALAACDSSETTKKKKKTKKTSEDTEDTTEDTSESDDTTEDTEDTKDSTDDSTDDTSTAPSHAPSTELTIYEGELESLGAYVDYYYRIYGEMNDEYDTNDSKNNTSLPYVSLYCDDLYFTADYDALNDALDDIFVSEISLLDDAYVAKLNDYTTQIQSGVTPDWGLLNLHVDVFRGDSQFLSFAMETSEDYLYAGVSQTHTLYANNGAEIKLSDVVYDKAAFADYVTTYLFGTDFEDKTTEIVEGINNGTIGFTLGYDGIFLAVTDLYGTRFVKVPVADLGTCVDLSFFGSTPEYYTLFNDAHREVTWDFNADGQLDTLKFIEETDEYDSIIAMHIELNGNVYSFMETNTNPFPSYGGFDSFFIMKTDSGYYLYVNLWGEDASSETIIFRITDDMAVEYSSYSWADIEEYPFNPDEFRAEFYTDVGGSSTWFGYFSAIGTGDGSIMNYNDFLLRERNFLVTRTDLKAYDIDTMDEITVPAGTAVSVRGLLIDEGQIAVEILMQDEADNFVVFMDIDDSSWPILVAGVDQQQKAFYGIAYAG